MRLVVHLARAALVFWVAAILLPTAAAGLDTVPRHPSSQAAMHSVAGTADTGRAQVAELTAGVHETEDDIRALTARLRLEVERFIAQLP